MLDAPLPTPRRTFLQRLAAGTTLLTASGWASTRAVAATPPHAEARASDDSWLDRIRGEHRQVFDLVESNRGFGAAYALNYIDSYHETHPGAEVTAVVVFRHFAMPLLLADSAWSKYNIGAIINVNDPETQAPAKRNIFRANVPMRPGLTYEQMMADHGIIMTACNLALTVISGIAAGQAGVSADQAPFSRAA